MRRRWRRSSTAQNIPHQISADGKTVSVPADKLDAARMQTASQGQPHSGRMGFELFDKMSWGQTEFDEKVAYQRALEGELERTIETLADVEQARVHLVHADRFRLSGPAARREGVGHSEAAGAMASRRTRSYGDLASWFPARWTS